MLEDLKTVTMSDVGMEVGMSPVISQVDPNHAVVSHKVDPVESQGKGV